MANSITLAGSPIPQASSPNPDMCRVSGYLINAQGQALKGWSFVLRYCYAPLGLYGGSIVLQERLTIKADAEGYVEFDLLRGAKLTIELPNLLIDLDTQELVVPDVASVDLLAFLFPYVVSVDWEDDTAVSIGVAERFTVGVVGTLSNGETVTFPSGGVTISVSNDSVVDLAEGFTYEGKAAGSATLTLDAVDVSTLELNRDREEASISFLNVPDPTIAASPLSVTVS